EQRVEKLSVFADSPEAAVVKVSKLLAVRPGPACYSVRFGQLPTPSRSLANSELHAELARAWVRFFGEPDVQVAERELHGYRALEFALTEPQCGTSLFQLVVLDRELILLGATLPQTAEQAQEFDTFTRSVELQGPAYRWRPDLSQLTGHSAGIPR